MTPSRYSGAHFNQVHVNQTIDWESAPSSLVYYFATIVGDMPDTLLRLLPVETREELWSVAREKWLRRMCFTLCVVGLLSLLWL